MERVIQFSLVNKRAIVILKKQVSFQNNGNFKDI